MKISITQEHKGIGPSPLTTTAILTALNARIKEILSTHEEKCKQELAEFFGSLVTSSLCHNHRYGVSIEIEVKETEKEEQP